MSMLSLCVYDDLYGQTFVSAWDRLRQLVRPGWGDPAYGWGWQRTKLDAAGHHLKLKITFKLKKTIIIKLQPKSSLNGCITLEDLTRPTAALQNFEFIRAFDQHHESSESKLAF